jgi:glutamyl-queuosine tRNA(Asp) synthetase
MATVTPSGASADPGASTGLIAHRSVPPGARSRTTAVGAMDTRRAYPARMVVGRFAPSPSGRMHLGNARTALLAWLDARARGGRILLRVEDLDRDRCRPELADAVRRDLDWLGLGWDAETPPQSTRDETYAAAIARLDARGLLYRCTCTRRDLAAASAPHGSVRRYPGTCRDAGHPAGVRSALRLRMPARAVAVTDRLLGGVTVDLADAAGDIVVRRADGLHGYQLAVVVDDAADGVTDVVRGDDLWPSTPAQAALQDLLGLTRPAYAHVPLVLDAGGERLAKRHAGATLASLREAGVPAARVVGGLAHTLGLAEADAAVMPADLVAGFSIEAIARAPAVIDPHLLTAS